MQIEAKKFFRGCRRLDPRIEAKCDELERIRAQAERVTASYSDEPRGGGGPTSRVENAVIRYVDMEHSLSHEVDQMCDYRMFARRVIDGMSDDRYRDILNWRYFSGWSWEQIASAFDKPVGEKWVLKLHGRALGAAQRAIDEMTVPERVQNYYLIIYPPGRE